MMPRDSSLWIAGRSLPTGFCCLAGGWGRERTGDGAMGEKAALEEWR